MKNTGLDEAQARIKIARKNIINLIYADDTTRKAEREEELKSFLMKVKEECEKVGLKLNIQKTKIKASSPITSWEIDGETVETVADFIFGAPKSLQMVMDREAWCAAVHGVTKSRTHWATKLNWTLYKINKQ